MLINLNIMFQVNTFQVVLATDEFETFAFFRYERVQWTAGTESGASENTGDTGVAALVSQFRPSGGT
jgi:hypothetical protein